MSWLVLAGQTLSGPEWGICQHNAGFGGSSFISFAVAFNVALAKWEPLRKSLLDVRAQSKELFDKRIGKESATSLFVDERHAKDAQIARSVCQDHADKVGDTNEVIWLWIRYGAIVAAICGAAALFLQMSLGLHGLLLFIPPLLTWISVVISRYRIRSFIAEHYSHNLKRLKKEAETKSEEDAKKMAKALDERIGKP